MGIKRASARDRMDLVMKKVHSLQARTEAAYLDKAYSPSESIQMT